MALRGNLKDFSLPDVFQLVTFSKKTGVLRIRRADGAEGSVWFREGEVFFAQSNWHREPLGERLVHANRITPSALVKALEIRKVEPEDGRRLGQILVDEGYITDKVLEAFVQEQIQDTIFDLMRWDEGEFDFELLPEIADEDIGLSVSIENVIMEGSRRLEEWTRIKKKIPSMDIVFKMATAPGEGTFEISLKPIEWNLLLLVDGTRSVSDLARDTSRTDFEVARIMYGLFSAGLLEVASDEEIERLRAERTEREALLAELRAKEVEAEQQAVEATMAREEALAEEARQRLEAEEAPIEPEALEAPVPAAEAPLLPSTEAAPEEMGERPEPEMPEFLAAPGATEASAEDMAVFEQMMEAVLEAPAAPEPEAGPAPPTEVPEFLAPTVSEEPLEVSEMSDVLLEALPEEAVLEAPAIAEPGVEAGSEVEFEPGLAVEAGPEAEVAAGPEPAGPVATGDFEADLMALGLGEMPSEALLEPAGTEPEAAPAELEAPAELQAFLEDMQVQPEAAVEAPAVEEPAVEAPAAKPELLAAEAEPEALVIEPESLEIGPETLVIEPEALEIEEAPGEPTPDLSDILSSLEEDQLAEAPPEIVKTEAFEEEMEEPQEPSAGVISTDAYLADISSEGLGMGLSGGLGDELSALTGAGRPQRPSASVKKIPEPGAPLELRRDQTVDKDLILKIIHGLENL